MGTDATETAIRTQGLSKRFDQTQALGGPRGRLIAGRSPSVVRDEDLSR